MMILIQVNSRNWRVPCEDNKPNFLATCHNLIGCLVDAEPIKIRDRGGTETGTEPKIAHGPSVV
jgi:hypothetical protein